MVSAPLISDDARSLERHFSELDELGYTVLTDLLSALRSKRP